MMKVEVKKRLEGEAGTFQFSAALDLEPGDIALIQGPSGAGKSTFLRMLAGLTIPDQGKIVVDGEIWFSKKEKTILPVHKRSLGMVFQDYGLFPHLNVENNLRFGMDAKSENADERVEGLLKRSGLWALRGEKPGRLSGGQQQRVAICRSLVRKPRILLLDEPLSSLDRAMREKMADLLVEFCRQNEVICLWVTHDLQNAPVGSSRLFAVQNGQLVSKEVVLQSKTPVSELAGTVMAVQEDFLLVEMGEEVIRVERSLFAGQELKIGQKVRWILDAKSGCFRLG